MHPFIENILFAASTVDDGNMSFRIGETQQALQNRKQFLLKHGVNFKSHICMKCDHGTQITTVNRSNLCYGSVSQKDMLLSEVLVTQEKGLALMLLTADCLPVSFYDPITQTIALAHFSRQTIAKLLPKKTIDYLRGHFSIDPANLIIQIGPYIHTNSYLFPAPQPTLPEAINPYAIKTDTYVCIDLISACTAQLTKEGVILKNIYASLIDTATSSDHFSHYRSEKQNVPEGRLATILMITR